MCASEAVADAIVAATAAANTASTWVTIGTYGAGANAKIAPGGGALAAIQFPNNTNGGFKIMNLDVADAQAVGIDFASSNTVFAQGLRVEGGTASNITGMHVVANSSDTVYNAAGINVFAGTAINVWRTNYVSIVNHTVASSDMPYYVQGCSDVLIANATTSRASREGPWLSYIQAHSYPVGPFTQVVGHRALIQGGVFGEAGYQQGTWWGVAGVQFNGGIDQILRGAEVWGTTGIPGVIPDQVGFDQEGYLGDRTAVLDNNIHGNLGAAALFDGFGGGATNSVVAGNTINVNGGLSSGTTYPTFLRIFHTTTDNMVVGNNTITRFLPAPSQKVNDIEDLGPDPQGKTDSYPARFTQAGNTVTN